MLSLVLLRFQNVSFRSVSVGFPEKNLGFRFGLGFHDKRVVNFFVTRVIWPIVNNALKNKKAMNEPVV